MLGKFPESLAKLHEPCMYVYVQIIDTIVNSVVQSQIRTATHML